MQGSPPLHKLNLLTCSWQWLPYLSWQSTVLDSKVMGSIPSWRAQKLHVSPQVPVRSQKMFPDALKFSLLVMLQT